jgi:hypothetical protein
MESMVPADGFPGSVHCPKDGREGRTRTQSAVRSTETNFILGTPRER